MDLELVPVPTNWSYESRYKEYNLVTISPGTAEYIRVINAALNFFCIKPVKKVVRIENVSLLGQYMLRKEEYESKGSCSVVELLHDTSENNVESIARYNFDWRKVHRAKFGRGVSFSGDAHYANKQSARSNGLDRAMILADVLIGNRQNVNFSFNLPNEGYDTNIGNKGKVYVKFYDNEFYPKYAVYYTNNTSPVFKLYNYF